MKLKITIDLYFMKLIITIGLYFIFGDRATYYNWLSLFLILVPETILRTDKGQPRPKYMFNKCGTNIYIFTLQRFSPSSNFKFNCILLLGMKLKMTIDLYLFLGMEIIITIDLYFLLGDVVNNYNWPGIFFFWMELTITTDLYFLLRNGVNNYNWPGIFFFGMELIITIDLYFLLRNGVNNYNWPVFYFWK